jgi:hypothetical protein
VFVSKNDNNNNTSINNENVVRGRKEEKLAEEEEIAIFMSLHFPISFEKTFPLSSFYVVYFPFAHRLPSIHQSFRSCVYAILAALEK